MESAIPAQQQAHAPETPAIAVMEADLAMRSLLREWLTTAGYGVRDGLPRHGGSTTRVDLVIVDLYMPRQGGARIIRGVQRLHPGTPVIAISGQFRPGLAANSPVARALGATRVVAKPFSRADLLEAVGAVVGLPR
jgi:CheY-like chemotaxis protein